MTEESQLCNLLTKYLLFVVNLLIWVSRYYIREYRYLKRACNSLLSKANIKLIWWVHPQVRNE